MVMQPKDADRMANSVYPDRNSLIWIYTVCPDLSVRKQDHYGNDFFLILGVRVQLTSMVMLTQQLWKLWRVL